MGRPVKIRTTYTADRGRLARLEEAVLKDYRLREDDRGVLLVSLQRLGEVLLKIDGYIPKPERKRKKAA